ncbi:MULTISPECIES: hypothetical protein [Kitasatospora]|uniref:Uncharacterized protein n=2 Tax=Kitasatospora TaxID=2063 RepID=A0ABT1IPN9_9ACTN|nr:hypothetical protein [Kitasatospora paracochleata]MCP2306974.1 hypothetical protein [Kitasatospora paracochleata]
MTQTAQKIESVTGLVPGPRRPEEPVTVGPRSDAPGFADSARHAFALLRGLRSLRPVPARPQRPYGEVDGQ